MKIGATDISAVKIGATDVNKVYLGANLVWEKVSPLLLDLYPNAAAAYSLRKLRTAYAGASIKVRRSSDNTEQDIGFVDNELDTASLLAFVGSGDGFVTTWYDQSGGGNDASQTTAANQPQIVSSGSVILENGKPSFQFDGSDDWLRMSNLHNITRLDQFFIASTTDQRYAYPDNFFTSSSKFGFAAHIGNTNATITENYGSPSLYINSSIFSGTTRGDVYNAQNGYKLIAHINASTTLWTYYSFGQISAAGYPFNGKLQELIAYNSDQSSNRTGIETNINSHYNIY